MTVMDLLRFLGNLPLDTEILFNVKGGKTYSLDGRLYLLPMTEYHWQDPVDCILIKGHSFTDEELDNKVG